MRWLILLLTLVPFWPFWPPPRPAFHDQLPDVDVPRRSCKAGVIVGLKHEPWHWYSMVMTGPNGLMHVETFPDPRYTYQVRICNSDDEPAWYGVPEGDFRKLRLGDYYEPKGK